MNIVVYCGASEGNSPIFKAAAVNLGEWIAQNGYTLVYGGGKVGLMGLIADTVLANGGEVIGVIPSFLVDRELAHPNLTTLEIVDTMSTRKAKMLKLGDACIALPGGPGTLEEITEVVSWARVGQNDNPCIFLDVNGFYQPVKAMYDSMVDNGFLTQADRDKTLFSDSLSEIDGFIGSYEAPGVRQYK